jgi:hypothetical protein
MTNKELDELYKLYDEYILYKEEFEKNQELLLKLRFYQKEYDENFGKNERIETSCRYYSSLDKKDIRLYYNKVPTGFNINGARFCFLLHKLLQSFNNTTHAFDLVIQQKCLQPSFSTLS